jgi:FkbM family methyltransferase
MSMSMRSRAAGDLWSVCRRAAPGDAVRWMTALASHLPDCARSRCLSPADVSWERTGARFRTPSGACVALPGSYTAGAREMYCRNVYLRTGLSMPADGWVIDLGANRGLFSVWAAVTGAQVVAVEAQRDFAPLIQALAVHNDVQNRVHVEVGMASGVTHSGSAVGLLADDEVWASASHGAPARPRDLSVPELMARYWIDQIALLKVDIEGGEFALLAAGDDLSWLEQVNQIALEVHPDHGSPADLAESLRRHGFTVDLRDNDGLPAPADSTDVSYAYGWRR